MHKYQDILNGLLEEDFNLLTKLNILYELNCCCDTRRYPDWLVDKIYQAYLDNGNYFDVASYIRAILDYCDSNEIDFDKIEDYDKLLKEIY